MRWYYWLVVQLLLLALVVRVLAGQVSERDGLNSRAAAWSDSGLHVVVSIELRRLWVIGSKGDTLLATRVAVGSGRTLRVVGRSWTFETPRGVHQVISKEIDPVWVRPDWSYIESARKHGLRLVYLDASRPRRLSDGTSLVTRDRVVGRLAEAEFTPLPLDEEIVFDGVLYVPPLDAQNRRVPSVLGKYRLNLGEGVGLHGTLDYASIGHAATHGCIRLGDADLEWLYANVPVGALVVIY